MISLTIPDIKDFMNKLLVTGTFDHFLLVEATISTNVSFVIDGHLNKDFYSADELEIQDLQGLTFTPFSMLRSTCYDLTKGKKTPLFFKYTFQLSPSNTSSTLNSIHSAYTVEDISGILLNIRFQNNQLTITTGISYRTFSLDHTLDHEWDSLVQRFLTANQIAFENLN